MPVLNKLIHYQKKIERNNKHTETLIHCINQLHKLPVTLRHLEITGIGKTINGLRNFDGDIANVAKALVWKWKRVVIETFAEEHAEKQRSLKNPIVSNPEERVLNAVKTEEEEEEQTHVKEDRNALRNTTGNCGTKMLREIHEKRQISSTVYLNCNDSAYVNCHCDTSHQFTEREDKAHSSAESISHVFAIHQSSPKTEKQKYSHHRRHSSKHHNHNRRNKPKHNKKAKEVDRSELRIKEDGIKIKLEKVYAKNRNNKQEEKKSVSSGSSYKHRHSKRAENKNKYLDNKYCRKDRGQKLNTGLSEISTKDIPKQLKPSEKVKDKIAYNDNIDHFAEALRMGDCMGNIRLSSTTTSTMRNSDSKSSPGIEIINIPFNSKPQLCLADVEMDLVSMLSEMSPNYNPLPHLPLTVEEKDVAKQVPLPKQHRQRMKVYSGVKTGLPIPTLYDLCVRVLKEHIDALEYTGGVPYDILKPILQQATPEQLFQVEYYNPYLIEDTNELWEFHCRKEFRSEQLQPMETAREMYLRCLDEREAKLRTLTCNIQQSLIKLPPVRKTKLAYVDSDPKPPRNVAKEQAKYGTGSIPKSDDGKSQRSAPALTPLTSTVTLSSLNKSSNATARTPLTSTVTPSSLSKSSNSTARTPLTSTVTPSALSKSSNLTARTPLTSTVTPSSLSKSSNSTARIPLTSTVTSSFLKKSTISTTRTKPRLAPLMRKTMKLAKSFKR